MDTWDWFQWWLSLQSIDVIGLQETHWSFTREWIQERFYIVHSGMSSRAAGLMFLVSRKLCEQHDISWGEIVPGRLLHLRLHGVHRHIDIVNLYQHVHAPQRMDDRAEVWHQLSLLLAQLPKRNTLVLLGDTNTSLRTCADVVGIDTYAMKNKRCRGPEHSDTHQLQTILKTFSLTALNTWTHDLGPTYQFDLQHSRIDFICCRTQFADATSKQVQYLTDFPLLCHGGAFHVPMITSLLKAWNHNSPQRQQGWTRHQRVDLCHQWLHPNERTAHLQQRVCDSLTNLPDSDTPFDLVHQTLHQFTAPTTHHAKEPVHRFDITPFQQFQEHTMALRALHGTDLRTVFQAWHHIMSKCKARRVMKQNSKLARKRRLQQIYEAADRAEQAHDHFRLYQAIRTIAPKQQYRRVMLRAHDGTLLTPAQAADSLCDWFSMVYHSDVPQPEACSFDWPFTQDEFQAGLHKLPLSKALDPVYAPAPFWRCAAQQIAHYLDPYLHQCSQTGQLPRAWSQGHLCFLPKPNKKCHAAADLRPITFLDPCGKTLFGVFSDELHSQVWPYLRGLPQYAYLPGRGTEDALHRIATCCREVRDLLDSQKFVIHNRASDNEQYNLVGGIMLSLDLSQAFDVVDRPALYAGLASLGVSDSLLSFLKSVYSCTSYKFDHRGHQREFPTTRGIRQGCRAAPALWATQAALLLQQFMAVTSESWVLDHSTIYADDSSFHEVLTSEDQLHRVLRDLGRILDVLEKAKMQVNLSKTTVMLRLRGRALHRLQKQYIKRLPDGGAQLKIPRGNGTFSLIRLVKQQQYLGTTVSFYNFERQTMICRLKAAEKTNLQLTRWLYAQRHLSPHQRTRSFGLPTRACDIVGLTLRRQSRHIHSLACIVIITMSSLRRHLTIAHGDRGGPLRVMQSPDIADGVPTCARCGQLFTTWHRLQYHVQFVCQRPQVPNAETLESAEHRARVHELLQVAFKLDLQAFVNTPTLREYFRTRCSLCQHFSLTARGLLSHMQTAHPDLFLRHTAIHASITKQWHLQSPCILCGDQFKQYHHCILVRQLAVLLAREGHVIEHGQSAASFQCPTCFKVFGTRHGLRQHVQQYHSVVEVCNDLPSTLIDVKCFLAQAVENNNCTELLQMPEVLQFVSSRCALCDKHFSRKQDLTRHFGQNHAHLWTDSMKRAIVLDTENKPTHGCICIPPQRYKHVCCLYQQFALLRLDHERQQQAQDSVLPPEQYLSIGEQIAPILWSGQPSLLYKLHHLRIQLTQTCQLCGQPCGNAEGLEAHLRRSHAAALSDAKLMRDILHWCMFQCLGCFCNPSPGWGEPHHRCVSITQLALMVTDFGWPVAIPWAFSTNGLLAYLGDLLYPDDFRRLSTALITRNFPKIWQDRTLTAVLSSQCILCQEAVPLPSILAHLQAIHQVTAASLRLITHQICHIFAELAVDYHCDWCGALFIDAESPEEHFKQCAYVIQLALLLMTPVLNCDPLTDAWPSQETIWYATRQDELQLWRHQAMTSDPFGQHLEQLAHCGLLMLRDPQIEEMMNHQCLLCSRKFFMPNKFSEHLHRAHNFHQLRTLMCYHRLLLAVNSPCQFCGLLKHHDQCLPLLNLAIFLVNGHPLLGAGRHGCGHEDLGQLAHSGPVGIPGNIRQATSIEQKTKNLDSKEEAVKQPIWIRDDGSDGALDDTMLIGGAARGQPEHPSSGVGIPDLDEPRSGLSDSHLAPDQQDLAPGQQRDDAPSLTGQNHDSDLGRPPAEAPCGGGDCGVVPRLHGLPPDSGRLRPDDALPQVEPSAKEPAAHFEPGPAHCGSHEVHLQHPSNHGGSACDSPLPCSEEADGAGDGGRPMALDHFNEVEPRTVVRVGQALLPQHLAAHPDPSQAPKPGSATFGQIIAEGDVTFGAVRIFLNPTGKACPVNAVIACLAWQMLLSDGFHGTCWRAGFELMRNVTLCSCMPVDLFRHDPFKWLLFGDWTIEKFLRRQQDACEFCDFFLNFTQPKFLCCRWDTRPSFVDGLRSVHLDGEKGTRFSPIQLPFIDHLSDSVYLQELVDAWHDDQGLCRSLVEVGSQLVLMIERHSDSTHTKCQQRIGFPNNHILFPCFSDRAGDIQVDLDQFEISGVVFHLGTSPHHGHYQAALRYRGGWMVYDDNRLPVPVSQLSDTILRNCVLIWLVRLSPHNDRTMSNSDGSTPNLGLAPPGGD
eukprot:s1539_g4.t1